MSQGAMGDVVVGGGGGEERRAGRGDGEEIGEGLGQGWGASTHKGAKVLMVARMLVLVLEGEEGADDAYDVWCCLD